MITNISSKGLHAGMPVVVNLTNGEDLHIGSTAEWMAAYLWLKMVKRPRQFRVVGQLKDQLFSTKSKEEVAEYLVKDAYLGDSIQFEELGVTRGVGYDHSQRICGFCNKEMNILSDWWKEASAVLHRDVVGDLRCKINGDVLTLALSLLDLNSLYYDASLMTESDLLVGLKGMMKVGTILRSCSRDSGTQVKGVLYYKGAMDHIAACALATLCDAGFFIVNDIGWIEPQLWARNVFTRVRSNEATGVYTYDNADKWRSVWLTPAISTCTAFPKPGFYGPVAGGSLRGEVKSERQGTIFVDQPVIAVDDFEAISDETALKSVRTGELEQVDVLMAVLKELDKGYLFWGTWHDIIPSEGQRLARKGCVVADPITRSTLILGGDHE